MINIKKIFFGYNLYKKIKILLDFVMFVRFKIVQNANLQSKVLKILSDLTYLIIVLLIVIQIV